MKVQVLLILLVFALASGLQSQTEGTLSVVVTTSAAGGGYAPRNIVAIWVENEQGAFVKTLMAYAANRRTHLNIWEQSTTAAGSPFNVVDAISGSTRNSHDTRNCTWDGTDVNGTLMPDGNYKLRMELTDKNSTGNYSTFNFVKNAEAYVLSPENVPSFAGIGIEWEPVITSITDYRNSEVKIVPNPGNTIVSIEGVIAEQLHIYAPNGSLLMETTNNQIDISSLEKGFYLLSIYCQDGRIIQKKLIRE